MNIVWLTRRDTSWNKKPDQCDQIWRNSKVFVNIFKVHLVLDKVFNSLWPNMYTFGQNYIAVNGQIMKTQSGHTEHDDDDDGRRDEEKR